MQSIKYAVLHPKDPVCGMSVDPNNRRFTTTYKNCTYYFCAEKCLHTFESNPDKFLNEKPAKKKGWWGRYLERLERATDGKSMHCCH